MFDTGQPLQHPPSVGKISWLSQHFPTCDHNGIRRQRHRLRPAAGLGLFHSHPEDIRQRGLARPLGFIDVRRRLLESDAQALEKLAPARRCGAEEQLHRPGGVTQARGNLARREKAASLSKMRGKDLLASCSEP